MKVRVALLSTACLTALVLAPQSAQAAAPPQCGDTLRQSTTLTADLVCTGDVGLVVKGDDLVLDLNGHTVRGPGVAAGGTGVLVASGTSLTVTHGTVRGWGTGVRTSTQELEPVYVTLRRTTLRDNGTGLLADQGAEVTVTGSNLTGNRTAGAALFLSLVRLDASRVAGSPTGVAAGEAQAGRDEHRRRPQRGRCAAGRRTARSGSRPCTAARRASTPSTAAWCCGRTRCVAPTWG
ncbi:hypothetical protein GCM10025868_16610 [Angustibacter aerolatus]|uniref:Right handed beta helix domain-containing protein n=1 Tax=Angustibacter aerolatus TaxID=1162965 RepID=A0ABQ6JDZ5_9ACTN|nr:hypothetical protein [Angustibacter aerolatus]GMA86411.1 hypothetical protein GCM10025868_16610 [Angustibacter aerolatus]